MQLKKSKTYKEQVEILRNKGLRCLTDLRNKCAHYSRLYYWIFTALPRMPQGEKYIPTRRLFAQLYMLKLMYPDHKKWNEEFVKPFYYVWNSDQIEEGRYQWQT